MKSIKPDTHLPSNRRRILQGLTGIISVSLLPAPLWATPEKMATAISNLFGDTPIHEGKVSLKIPPLAENGNSVPLTVSIESPMTEEDFVKSIHIFSEQNPIPTTAAFYLGPRAGKAQISTRIRLSTSQTITAIAKMNNNSLWSGTAQSIITLAACSDVW